MTINRKIKIWFAPPLRMRPQKWPYLHEKLHVCMKMHQKLTNFSKNNGYISKTNKKLHESENWFFNRFSTFRIFHVNLATSLLKKKIVHGFIHLHKEYIFSWGALPSHSPPELHPWGVGGPLFIHFYLYWDKFRFFLILAGLRPPKPPVS